jgi:hypothetical protein
MRDENYENRNLKSGMRKYIIIKANPNLCIIVHLGGFYRSHNKGNYFIRFFI